MFETSMVAQPKVARRRAGLFTVSLIAHTAVILGAAVISVASVEFPKAAPDEMAHAPTFDSVQIPPPLGTPDAQPEPPQPQPQQQQTPPPPQPTEVTAPPVVPDETPVVDAPPSTGDSTTTATGPATGPTGRRGVPWGDPNSIETDLDLPPVVTNTVPVVEDKIYTVSGGVTAPVALHKVAPDYPRALTATRMSATVVVRCIIDKNGRVRDPQIVSGSLPPFNAETIKAVQQWRFTPGSYGGKAVDVYFDLTVTFRVTR